MRYKFTIEYDGSQFLVGWQEQKYSDSSVQKALKDAACALTKREIKFIGAGRTDAGVHATGQVAHADFLRSYGLKELQYGMNHYLSGCKIVRVEPVSNDFHARFDAKSKTYSYHIMHSNHVSVFSENYCWWIPKKLAIDWDRVISNSKLLVGTFDFSSFCDAKNQSDVTIRTMDELEIDHQFDKITFHFKARSFLHKQIRITVGTLIDIGRGRLADINDILQAKNRQLAGQTAPAKGLFLTGVEY